MCRDDMRPPGPPGIFVQAKLNLPEEFKYNSGNNDRFVPIRPFG